MLTQENRIVEEGSITVQFDLGAVYLSPLSGNYPKNTLESRLSNSRMNHGAANIPHVSSRKRFGSFLVGGTSRSVKFTA